MNYIFVSHWSVEAPVAILLKEWIENIFDNTHVFVSSSDRDIDYGDQWENTMMKALQQALFMIVLVSKRSYDRKWIHIETGFSLAKNMKLLIVRIDDILPEAMGRPYDNYQSIALHSPDFTKKFLQAISRLLRQELSSSIGYSYMQLEINEKAKEVLSNG